MGKYAESNLQKDEQIIVEAKFNNLRFVSCILWIVIGVILLIVSIFFLGSKMDSQNINSLIFEICGIVIAAVLLIGGVKSFIRNLTIELTVTNKRIIGKRGLVGIKSVDFHIDKVSSIGIRTSFFGRIFHYYTLVVRSSGNIAYMMFTGVENANEIKNIINAAIEKYAEEARRAQAEQMTAAMNMSGTNTDGNPTGRP